MTPKIGGLGKGLDALLPISGDKLPDAFSAGGPALLHIEHITANPNQPRKTFEPVALEELAATIKKNGVLQPILVEETAKNAYIIIAGERRLRAAKLAGLTEIPAIIRKFTPEESFLVSILENLQREDLNPIEEAAAFKQLMDISGLSQEGVAAKVGKNRATVANSIRLLKLPPAIQEALKTGTITAGHARALLSIDDTVTRIALFQDIIAQTLSVRETEKRAGEMNGASPSGEGSGGESAAGKSAKKNAVPVKRDIELASLEEKFIKALGTKVRIEGDMNGGLIKIEYFSADDLERLHEIFVSQEE
ncbi:MAG: ParB/RepB/Spo0J family partition protein [Spirochaetaceae bacterium]|jgi:ParB family chromosome partitioning protein|nr:ParB/RepB/Spo0J family partition protein [Spirochaetaceae bacterium]